MMKMELKNGIKLEVQEQYMKLEDVITICEDKIIKALSTVDENVQIDYSYSYNADTRVFSDFVIYPSDVYEQAEYLDSISDGYTWFTETSEMYRVELSIFDVLKMDTIEIAEMVRGYAKAYNNSVYIACSKDAVERDGLLNEIYAIEEEPVERVFTRIEDIVLEHNEDFQQIASYVLDTKTDELCYRDDVPYFEYKELHNKKYGWVEVIR